MTKIEKDIEPPIIVLDACVIYSMPLCDTLLRIAEDGFYRLRVSQEILDEVTRNLIKKKGKSIKFAERFETEIKACFPEALVNVPQWQIQQMKNHPKDRHVLATAVQSQAQLIITTNLKDFPDSTLLTWGIKAQHPDQFLSDIWESNDLKEEIIQLLIEQSRQLSNPPISFQQLLTKLEKQTPHFVSKVLNQLDIKSTRDQL